MYKIIYERKISNNSNKYEYNLKSDKLEDISKLLPVEKMKMDSLLNAYYHSTKYLYFNNKK